MIALEVSSLKADSTFNTDLMLDNQFLLCTPPCPLTPAIIKALNEWSFREVVSESPAKKEIIRDPDDETNRNEASKINIGNTSDVSDMFIEEVVDSQTEKIKEQIKLLENQKPDEDAKMEYVRQIYNEYMNYINRIYITYATRKHLNVNEISSTVKKLCSFISENHHYILRVSPNDESYNKNIIVSHSMRSTVIAVTIAQQLKLSEAKIAEIGVACILHEIGQMRIPPQLYLTDKPLSPSERAKLNTHPILSYNILKECGFSQEIQQAVLEHHEKENGQGYPRKLTAEKISLYAKIISVACSFEALTAPRRYKDEKTAYTAMTELLKNEGTPYNPAVVKALLLSLSMYSLGSYVYLSNGKIARVVDTNTADPKNPVVQLADGSKQIIKTSDLTTRVMRTLTKKETEDFLSQDNKA
ncbi:MAG: HD domain-containing protein [Treponema sp.]|nr:HD domain-containing protein [Treponema sp.]